VGALKTLLLTIGLQSGMIWESYGYDMIPQGVSMDEDLRNIGALLVDSLKLLRHNVLTLREFEDVLDAINDLQGFALNKLSYISGM
jgi:hypothetical protein